MYSSDERFSFKYFINIAFVRGISSELVGSFGCYRHELVADWLQIQLSTMGKYANHIIIII